MLYFVGISILVIGVLYCVECVAFLRMWRRYATLGPALHREEWQSSVGKVEAEAAIRRALPMPGFVARERDGIFFIRRPSWNMGAWPRSVLRVSDGPHGAILSYEVRPFISMGLMGVAAMAGIFVGMDVLTAVGTFVVIALIYLCYFARELRLFGGLRPIRKQLASIGVQVCDHCGYDLFERDLSQPCPECGKVANPAADTMSPAKLQRE